MNALEPCYYRVSGYDKYTGCTVGWTEARCDPANTEQQRWLETFKELLEDYESLGSPEARSALVAHARKRP